MNSKTAISFAIGMTIGAVVGITSDNIAMDIDVGIAPGLAVRESDG